MIHWLALFSGMVWIKLFYVVIFIFDTLDSIYYHDHGKTKRYRNDVLEARHSPKPHQDILYPAIYQYSVSIYYLGGALILFWSERRFKDYWLFAVNLI